MNAYQIDRKYNQKGPDYMSKQNLWTPKSNIETKSGHSPKKLDVHDVIARTLKSPLPNTENTHSTSPKQKTVHDIMVRTLMKPQPKLEDKDINP